MTTLDDVAIAFAVALDDHTAIAIAIDVAANQRPNGAADDGARLKRLVHAVRCRQRAGDLGIAGMTQGRRRGADREPDGRIV